MSVVSLAYAAVFFCMAQYLYNRNREAFILLLAKALLFLIVTVPIYFSEHWITFFWSIQGAALMWAALRIGDSRLRSGAAVLLLIAAAKLVSVDYVFVFDLQTPGIYFPRGFANALIERWGTILVTLGTLFLSASMLKAFGFDKKGGRIDLTAGFFGLFAVLLLIAANIEVAAYFHDAVPRARSASISVLWALFAIALMVIGFAANSSVLRRCSFVLFAVTIVKVFVTDMANVDTPFRIVSFLILGLLLVGASYLYHRYKNRILPAERDASLPARSMIAGRSILPAERDASPRHAPLGSK